MRTPEDANRDQELRSRTHCAAHDRAFKHGRCPECQRPRPRTARATRESRRRANLLAKKTEESAFVAKVDARVAAGATHLDACDGSKARVRRYYRVRNALAARRSLGLRPKDAERRSLIARLGREGPRTADGIALVVEGNGHERPDPSYVNRVIASEGLDIRRRSALGVLRAALLHGVPEPLPRPTRRNGLRHVGTVEDVLDRVRAHLASPVTTVDELIERARRGENKPSYEELLAAWMIERPPDGKR